MNVLMTDARNPAAAKPAVRELFELPVLPEPEARHVIVLLGAGLKSWEEVRGSLLRRNGHLLRTASSCEILSVATPGTFIHASINAHGSMTTVQRDCPPAQAARFLAAALQERLRAVPSRKLPIVVVEMHGSPCSLQMWDGPKEGAIHELRSSWFAGVNAPGALFLFRSCAAAADEYPLWGDMGRLRGKAVAHEASIVRAPLLHSEARYVLGFTAQTTVSCDTLLRIATGSSFSELRVLSRVPFRVFESCLTPAASAVAS